MVFNATFNNISAILWWSVLFFIYFSSPASWETIFSKSTENIGESEMNCCRRIVQLCKDCLLIVYQILWWSVLLVEETRVSGENHRSVASHWQTLSHVVLSTPCLSEAWTHNISGVYSTNKTDHHNIAEILLKVALNTINLT
jgi:hypothetical protein